MWGCVERLQDRKIPARGVQWELTVVCQYSGIILVDCLAVSRSQLHVAYPFVFDYELKMAHSPIKSNEIHVSTNV